MKRKLLLIMGVSVIVLISGGFLTWFFFFNQPPTPQDEKPDLTISNYTLENDNLTVTIANIGKRNVQDASIMVTMGMVTYYQIMIVYLNEVSLAVNESFVFTITFTDFKDELVSGELYIVNIQLDNGNHIDELSETNNSLSIEYYYEEDILLISGSGITANYSMTLTEVKSDKYTQVKNHTYQVKNSLDIEFDLVFSGVSLWSILEVEALLSGTPAELTFQFVASDGYSSPSPLNLSLAQSFPDLVIIAYEEDGNPLIDDGPLRSVVNQSLLMSGQYASQYALKHLTEIIIS